MGKITIEKWKCDRCGVVLDARPYREGGAYYSLRASADYVTAGGVVIDWQEMCAPCNSDVGKAIAVLQADAKAQKANNV